MQSWRRAIAPLLNKVRDNVEPLLHGWLVTAQAADPQLSTLRLVYLPDIILGYIWILKFSGLLLTRSTLLESMDLATVIADDKNKLSELFVESGRMEELVGALADSSQSVVEGRELHGKHAGVTKRKTREMGWSLGIWGVDFEIPGKDQAYRY